jgi:hypothetical protein
MLWLYKSITSISYSTYPPGGMHQLLLVRGPLKMTRLDMNVVLVSL